MKNTTGKRQGRAIRRKVLFCSRYGADRWAYVNMEGDQDGWISQRAYKALLKRMGLDRDNYHWAYQLRLSRGEDLTVRILKGDDCVGWID